jgi:hypothetical protein
MVASKKSALKPHHKEARLIYAQRLVQWDVQKWMDVVFRDEKTFSNFRQGIVRECRLRGEKPTPYTFGTSRYIKINVYGAITFEGVLVLKKCSNVFVC